MKCRYCQSEIDDKCTVCPVCKRDLVEVRYEAQQTTLKSNPVLFITIGVIMVIIVIVDK